MAAAQYESTTDEGDDRSTLQMSAEFRQRCGLSDDIGATPHFESDDSTLHAHGQNVLDAVAHCLTEGPLQNETITLIGRADPRGSEQHNRTLGQNRAGAARDYLVRQGVQAERIQVVSRGEQGARGNDESTWAQDRRVDLELGNKTGNTAATASTGTARTADAPSSSPILKGAHLQIQASDAKEERHPNAMSYSDTAEGAKPTAD